MCMNQFTAKKIQCSIKLISFVRCLHVYVAELVGFIPPYPPTPLKVAVFRPFEPRSFFLHSVSQSSDRQAGGRGAPAVGTKPARKKIVIKPRPWTRVGRFSSPSDKKPRTDDLLGTRAAGASRVRRRCLTCVGSNWGRRVLLPIFGHGLPGRPWFH